MKASRRKHRRREKAPRAPSLRQPVRRGPKPHPAIGWICALAVALGAILLFKVGTTLVEGVAWDNLETVTRQDQPFAFWMFVATYGVMGAGCIGLGVHLWRTR